MKIQNVPAAVHLEFFADPGHGWVQVPFSLLWELDLQDHISSYSFIDEKHVYIEQHGDYVRLRDAMSARGLTPIFKETRTSGDSPIRQKRSFDSSEMPVPALLDLTLAVEFSVLDEAGKGVLVEDSFNWCTGGNSCREDILLRLVEEVDRQVAHGWLKGKTFESARVVSVTRNFQEGKFLDFPVELTLSRAKADQMLLELTAAAAAASESAALPLEIQLDGLFLIKGDETSIQVIWNNLSGVNFVAPRANPDYTYESYLRMVEHEWGGSLKDGSVLTMHCVGQATILRMHTIKR
ncbi:hypothetical protein APB26_32075 [Pseudomonas aeruginosa]|uniref:DUF7688 family protein n=1 Tax=Pseudomonas aeruginosa TaxID=287 RepID=UPI00071BB6FA|nr:hypothetical protein [Pseudomonas aeruginosa]KSQ21623.1 hypothetical protein APB26_32075 [Pseudomonas aeruginosa]RPV61292.1 hypothetical protein IPC838_18405 [Pseudomonas aeruginosa]